MKIGRWIDDAEVESISALNIVETEHDIARMRCIKVYMK